MCVRGGLSGNGFVKRGEVSIAAFSSTNMYVLLRLS